MISCSPASLHLASSPPTYPFLLFHNFPLHALHCSFLLILVWAFLVAQMVKFHLQCGAQGPFHHLSLLICLELSTFIHDFTTFCPWFPGVPFTKMEASHPRVSNLDILSSQIQHVKVSMSSTSHFKLPYFLAPKLETGFFTLTHLCT